MQHRNWAKVDDLGRSLMKIQNIQALGLLIQKTRKAQKLTQEQLAALSGVGVRFLRELEHGKESCHLGKTFEILKALGIDVFVKRRNEDSQ